MLAGEKEKQRWAQEHAFRIGRRFEQWQKPLGINGNEYLEYLTKELINCCDEPAWKSLIESIS